MFVVVSFVTGSVQVMVSHGLTTVMTVVTGVMMVDMATVEGVV